MLHLEIPENLTFLAQAVAANPQFFKNIPQKILANEEFILKAIAANPAIFTLLPEGIQANEAFRLKAIAANPAIFKLLPPAIRIDRKFVAKAVDTNFKVLKILLSDAQIFLGGVPKNEQVSPKVQFAATFENNPQGGVQITFNDKNGWALYVLTVPIEKVQSCIEEAGFKFDRSSNFVGKFASVLRG
jgi:hypothetical protein